MLHTDEGDVRITLREDLSPVASAYFRDFARRQQPCRGCEFHRAEAVPEPGAIDNYGGPGPPYALVQGRFGVGARSDLPREGAPLVERDSRASLVEVPTSSSPPGRTTSGETDTPSSARYPRRTCGSSTL